MKPLGQIIALLVLLLTFLSVSGQEQSRDSLHQAKKQKVERNLYLEWDVDDVYAGIPRKGEKTGCSDKEEVSDTVFADPRRDKKRSEWHIDRSAANAILNIALVVLWMTSCY